MEKRDFNLKSFLTIPLIHLSVFIFLYLFFSFFGLVKEFPNSENIIRWDASWYSSIAKNGYQYFWYEASNSAFFPLFPYLWKITHLSAVGISLMNYLLCLTGLYLLFHYFEIKKKIILIYISLPSCVFFFLPFSESLFFLCTSIFLVGLKNNNQKWIVIGLLFSSFTRATAMFFIPSIIIMELFFAKNIISKQDWKNIFYYSLVSICGLMLVVIFQYAITGEWFAFAKQQVRYWHHRFSLPGFPFVTFGGDSIIWLDGIALCFGFVATFLLTLFGIRFLLKKQVLQEQNKPLWFSITYAFMVTVYCVFFDHKSYDGSTELVSLNRYLFATSFFLVFLNEILKVIAFNFKNVLVYFFIILITAITLGLGTPLSFLTSTYQSYHRTTFFFLIILLYLLLYFFSKHEKYGNEFSTSLIAINMVLSVIVFHLYIQNHWIA